MTSFDDRSNATGENEHHDIILPLVTEQDTCLPLSINVVAKYWNIQLPLDEAIQRTKKYPSVTNGNIIIEGIELAEKHGLQTKILHSSISDLKKFIDLGIPPIVILPGVQDTILHASVISGYDPDNKTISHYIPKIEKDGSFHVGVIPEEKFDRYWSEEGKLVIIIAPPDITSQLKSDPEEKSNRLCFEYEKYNLTQDTQKAIQLLEEALVQSPNNVNAHLFLGGILNEQNSADCINHYKECIKLNKNSYLAFRGLGNYFLKTKQYDIAEQYYSDAIAINPERFGPIYKNRGIARLEQKNNNSGAKSDLEKYLKYTPNAQDRSSIKQAIKEL